MDFINVLLTISQIWHKYVFKEFVTLIRWPAVLCLAGFGNLPGDMVCYFYALYFLFHLFLICFMK